MRASILIAIFFAGLIQSQAAEDIVIADFESPSYGNWKITGEAFGPGPTKGALPGQMSVDGFKGESLVNTFFNGDATTGTLTSPEFPIERNFISFLIGGGKNDEQLSIQLLVDGKIVRKSSGPNDKPGGSETLAPDFWDVSEFKGQPAIIRIIDEAKGGWGHINVDHIIQTDTKPKGFAKDVERTFAATQRYLHIPIKNGAAKRVVTLLVDGKVSVRNDIELADAQPDWWAPMDISAWRGKSLTLRVDKLHEDSNALKAIEQSDTFKDADTLYKERLRGQIHFSPQHGWNNDPNGCVFYKGEYHLFFQHNPYGTSWGNMHWGHAVSKDLVHWRELGDVLLPDEMGPMFSGSAVVDWKNTSGFGKEGSPPLVLFYTAAGNPTVQCLAYSNDGRTFTKYAANPILKQITGGNRDPKVIWHEPSQRWVMTLYVELKGVHTIHFFSSPNLKDWTFASRTDGFFECPDFFELLIDGDSSRKKWVLLGASSEYRVGTFDGQKFIAESPKVPGHRGKRFYAGQSFSDVPEGRRIFIGWFQTEPKSTSFSQSMTIPLELGLTQTVDGPRMTFAPAREMKSLRGKSQSRISGPLRSREEHIWDEISDVFELRTEFEPRDTKEVNFDVRGLKIVFDGAKQELVVDGHRAPAPLRNGKQRLIIFGDRTGLEIFASDGLCYVPMSHIFNPENKQLRLRSEGGAAHMTSLDIYELKSIWQGQQK